MKGNLKAIVFSTAIFPVMVSCNSESKGSPTQVKSEAVTANDTHDHTYACPMHPEVTGKEGDKCPKCGVTLEKTENKQPVAAGTYYMDFKATPQAIDPDKEVTLAFTPKKKDAAAEPVALDVQHEKKVHVILVSDDLSWFDHIHPELTDEGAYEVKAKFPAAGNYTVFADYKPTGGSPVVDKMAVSVAGAAPAAKTYTANKLTGSAGNYTFELRLAGGKLTTGTLQFEGILKKEGKEVDASTLDNYLGAKAHVVMIGLNEKEYLHVHPEVVNGKFQLHTTIEKPGIYRGWIQFNGDNKINTIDFTLNVSKGSVQEANKASSHSGGHDSHAGHSH